MSLKYLHWNNLLGTFLFNPSQESRIITLVLSEEDVISIARNSSFEEFRELDDKGIVTDFKEAWRAGYPGVIGNYVERISQEYQKALPFYGKGKSAYTCDGILVEYPPALMHLAGINLAMLQRNDASRYKRIRDYFELADGRFPNMNENSNWNAAWDNLIWWANDFKKGTYGILPSKSLSTERFEYIGKPYTFILLSRKQLKDYYKYFFENDIPPQAVTSNKVLLQAFRKVRASDNITAILSQDGNDDDKKLVFAILRQLYHAWDGTYLNEITIQQVRVSSLSRRLRLCFELDDDGYVAFSFRFKEDLLFTSQPQLEDHNITFSANHWSSPFRVTMIPNGKILKDETLGLKLVFKPVEHQVFVFVNGRAEGLNSQVFIESDHILRAANQYLLIRRSLVAPLGTWIEVNHGIDQSNEFLNNSDLRIWQLFQFINGFTESSELFQNLQLPTSEKLTIESGLKGTDRGEYVCGFPILAKLSGAEGSEELELAGPDVHRFPLQDGQYFEIPGNIPAGDYKLELLHRHHPVSLPNQGQLTFSPLTVSNIDLEELVAIDPVAEADSIEARGFRESVNLVQNNLFDYRAAPQLNLWKKDEVELETLDARTAPGLQLMTYMIFREGLSKSNFDQVLGIIKSNVSTAEKSNQDFYKHSRYTLSGLRENSRVTFGYTDNGAVNNIKPIKPWLFRLGNFQNFFIEGIKSGIQPFKGCLYVLGGAYTLKLLKDLDHVCKKLGAELKIYQEGDEYTLLPPSVFIYSTRSDFSAEELLAILGQTTILPFYRYLKPSSSLELKLEAFKNGRDWDLHIAARYQLFDPETFAFIKSAGSENTTFPSLAQYAVQAWEKYYILRFEENEIRYQGSIDPRWGKYALLHLLQAPDIFLFDEQKNILLIPAALRLPSEIGDNLFYLTGRAPSIQRLLMDENKMTPAASRKAGRLYLIYKGILKSTAVAIAQKTGHKIISKTILDHD